MTRLNAWEVKVDLLIPPEPIPHPYDMRYYRAIIYRTRTGKYGDEYLYHIWPGHGVRRDLKLDEMPDEVRKHYGIVMACDVSKERALYQDGTYVFLRDSEPEKQEMSMTVYTMPSLERHYVNPYPDEYMYIGWRVSQNIFCLVLTQQCLSSLRGETVSDEIPIK